MNNILKFYIIEIHIEKIRFLKTFSFIKVTLNNVCVLWFPKFFYFSFLYILLWLVSTSGDEELWELVSASTIDFLQYMFTYFQLIILAKKCCSNSKERYFGVNWVSTSKEKIWLCSNCLLIFTFLEFEKIVS